MTDLMEALGAAVEGKVCSVNCCQTDPVAVRNGRALCGRHRDIYDHGTSGKPCERCGSREWIETPNGAAAATCVACGFVEYDESVIEHSW